MDSTLYAGRVNAAAATVVCCLKSPYSGRCLGWPAGALVVPSGAVGIMGNTKSRRENRT